VAAGDTLDELQAVLGPGYVLQRQLGSGGMATVYLAQDAKHGRLVALKVLHSDLAASLGPERFRREIGLAARLQHPHILSVYDSGETSTGHLWFTMPYVEGESLRDRLRRERQLPVDEALRITREVAQALDYAHRRGIVHRDIKPENILLSDGQALVADFGIARALTPSDTEHTLTKTGITVGTPGYMSPEQASADRALDGRSDIYSLGAVLYEMLAGEPPFTGPTAQAVVAKMMSSEPPSVRRARPAVPEAADAAVHRALAPVPADRFATAADFARALEVTQSKASMPSVTTQPTRQSSRRPFPVGFALLGLGFLIGVGALFAWRSHSGSAGRAEGPVRVAVLPFENIGDSADAYFADGLTDAVRGKLTTVPGLAVIAPGSSSEYRHTSKTPQQISQELGGVRYLLVGKVRWAKNAGAQSRVQVSPVLVDVTTGTDSWQQPFDAPLTDVFQVQGDIAGRVVKALGVALNPGAQQTLTERPTENLEAYDAYLKGEEAAPPGANDIGSLSRAAAFYERSVALDSGFALGWAKLAVSEASLYFNGTASAERAEAARRAVERALALAPNSPDTYLAHGVYADLVLNDHPRALAAYTAGLKAAPSNAQLLTATSLVEQSLGRWDAALAHLRQAETLDLRNGLTLRRLATTYLWLRRYQEASATCDRLFALTPNNMSGIETKAMIPLAQGNLAAARAVLAGAPPTVDQGALAAHIANFWDLYWLLTDSQQQILLTLSPAPFGGDRGTWATSLAETRAFRGDAAHARIYADSGRLAFEAAVRATPHDAQSHAFLGLMLAYLGRKADAIREGQQAVSMVSIAQDGYSGPYYQHLLVRTYLLVGEPEKAIDALEPLLKVPYYLSPGWLKVDPTFAPLRGNPRFERLVSGS